MGTFLRFFVPVHKVLEYPWRHFTSLKLCKCSQIPNPSPRVASNPNRTKTSHIDLIICKLSTYTKLRYLFYGRYEWKLSNFWGNKKKSWAHLPVSLHLTNTRNKKIKPYIDPVSSFHSAIPGSKK